MKEIKLYVDDSIIGISVTQISDKGKYININATAFDVRDTNVVQMPEVIPCQD